MKKLVVFPNDPILAYYRKGEIKPRYFNSGNFFDEVHIISLCDQEVEVEKVQEIAGQAILKIYAIGGFSLRKPWGFLKFRQSALKLVTVIKPDVIRAYNPQLMGYLAAFCGRRLGIPSVLSLHNDYDELRKFQQGASVKKWLWRLTGDRFFNSYSLSKITKVICVSNFLTSYAKKYGAKDIEVIYNKVYSSQFYTKRNYNQKKTKPRILSVGRLAPQKNQESLIKAVLNLDVELHLIGDGINYNKLKLLAENLGIKEKVKFIKSVPHKEIQNYYWEADIFAMSSSCEGFCIPVLEAMASGLPVVVNNKEPLPEVLGDSGIVVEDNPQAFAKAFKELSSNSQLRRELGDKAHKRALDIDGEIMERKEMELYRDLVAQCK